MATLTTAGFDGQPWPPQLAEELLTKALTGAPYANSIATVTTDRSSFTFLTSAPTGPAFVAEGQPLPAAVLNDDSQVVAVCKIGCVLPITNEALNDASVDIAGMVVQSLKGVIAAQVDDQLLHGAGSPAPTGLIGQLPTATGTTFRAAVLNAVGALGDGGATADTLWLRPSTWAAERAVLATDGHPLVADPPGTFAGLRVVEVPALGAAQTVVGDSRNQYLIRRNDTTVVMSDAPYFTSDAVALRLTARLALGVPWPAGAGRLITVAP